MVTVPQFTMGANILPSFMEGSRGVSNALAQWQARNQQAEQMAQQDRRFQASNALAQAQFGMQKQRFAQEQEAAQRAQAQRDAVKQYLSNPENMAGVPQPLAGIAGVTGDPSGVQQYLLAQAKAQAQQRMAQSGPEGYGKAGAVFQDPVTGEFKAIQFGERGSLKTHSLGGIEPAKGVKTVDDGTGTRVISQASGKDVRRIATDIDGKKTAEAIGTARGKFIVAQPKLEMNLQALDSQNAMAKEEIGLALNDIKSGRVTGWAGLLAPYAPGTSAYALSRRLITLKALVGLDKLGEMRDGSATGASGLGALSEKEMDLLTSVFGSLEQKQDAGTLSRNLKRLEKLLDGRVKRLRDAYEKDKRLYGLGRGQGQYTRVPQQGGPVSAIPPPPAPVPRAVPPQAVQMLQANPTPETRAQFDEIFGAGAADRVLGGQ